MRINLRIPLGQYPDSDVADRTPQGTRKNLLSPPNTLTATLHFRRNTLLGNTVFPPVLPPRPSSHRFLNVSKTDLISNTIVYKKIRLQFKKHLQAFYCMIGDFSEYWKNLNIPQYLGCVSWFFYCFISNKEV